MKMDKKPNTLPYMEMYGGETRGFSVNLARSDGSNYSYEAASEFTVVLTFSPIKATSGWGKFAKAVPPVLAKTATITEDSEGYAVAEFDFSEGDTKELRGKYTYQIALTSSAGDVRVAQGHLYIKRNINTELITTLVYYTVTFTLDGETIYEETVKRRKKVSSFPAVTAPDGYDLAGWYDVDTGEEFTEDTPVTKDTTVEPEYECNHSLGTVTKAENLVSPTCTGNGKYESATYCSTCGKEISRETIIIAPTGHTASDEYVIENYVAPTCTVAGSQDIVYYCTTCGAEVTRATETIPATGHTAAEAVSENATAGVCTEGGSYDSVVYCSVCGAELSRVTVTYEAQGHQYVSVTTAPTCTEKGYTTYTCSVCGDSYVSDYTNATGHNYVAVVTAPTCTEAGFTTYTCSNCGDGYVTDITDATGHSYVSATVEPTCEEQGYTVYVCENCGDTYFDDYVNATGHSWDDGVVTTEPTCTATGVKTYTCSSCGETRTETVPATGHTTTTSTSTVTAATCTEAGSSQTIVYCTVCGEVISTTVYTIPATGHTEGESKITSTTAATCTEAGSYTVTTYCATCGEAIGTTTHTIAATGHTEGEAVIENYIEPTYSSEGSYDEVIYCETCGEELSRTSYTIDKLVGVTAYSTKNLSSSVGCWIGNYSGSIGDYWLAKLGVETTTSSFITVNSSLTVSSKSCVNLYYKGAAETLGDYMYFGGGETNSTSDVYGSTVRRISSSLTVSTLSAFNSSVGMESESIATAGDYIVFFGGRSYFLLDYSVTAYNTSGTRYTPTAAPSTTRQDSIPISTDEYAFFVGGLNYGGSDSGLEVVAYDSALTRYYWQGGGTNYARPSDISDFRGVTIGLYNVIVCPNYTYSYINSTFGNTEEAASYTTDIVCLSAEGTILSTWTNGTASLGTSGGVVLGRSMGTYGLFGDMYGNAVILDSSLTVGLADSMLSGGGSYYGLCLCGTVGSYMLFAHGNSSSTVLDAYEIAS